MKQLLNTLFVTSEDIYLSLEGENVLANRDRAVVARYPLHTLQSIVSFSYSGASPALMGKCAEAGIGLAFCSPRGRFLARTCGARALPASSAPCGITPRACRAAGWKMPQPVSARCFRKFWPLRIRMRFGVWRALRPRHISAYSTTCFSIGRRRSFSAAAAAARRSIG